MVSGSDLAQQRSRIHREWHRILERELREAATSRPLVDRLPAVQARAISEAIEGWLRTQPNDPAAGGLK